MRLRIGVNLGDVIEGADGVAGDAVNVAARLQALAKPGGVLISGAVYDQVHLKIPARYVDAGTRRVKNIEEPVRTFRGAAGARRGRGRARLPSFAHVSPRAARCGSPRSSVAFVAVAALGPLLARYSRCRRPGERSARSCSRARVRRTARSPCCRSST